MKNYDDFIKHINSKSDDNIHDKAANMLEIEFNNAKSITGAPDSTALIIAMSYVLKSYSVDLLEKYHEWLHK